MSSPNNVIYDALDVPEAYMPGNRVCKVLRVGPKLTIDTKGPVCSVMLPDGGETAVYQSKLTDRPQTP